ncbi:MAG: dihydropteroate synthase [Planctomycetota bacterium]|nr:dihydropteroate synthase [Planctomycetota bacterium]
MNGPAPTPAIWGIVNVTPDSFSDGGLFDNVSSAVEHAMHLVDQGATVLDIGGESTRPGAKPVSVEEEQRRVLPVIDALVSAGIDVPISVDTRRAEVAAPALDGGAVIVNDVSAGRDAGMFEVVAAAGAGLCLMHMQGEPRTMQADPTYDDVVAEVGAWLAQRVEAAEAAGVPRDRLWIDPGIGFGKRLEHNLALLRQLEALPAHVPGVRVLLGASRKSFLGALTDRDRPRDRVAGSLACVARAFRAGVDAVRVHDVAETRDLLRVLEAIEPAS